MEGRVDMVVIAAGTGGTITGVARKLKEYNPAIIVVGVDPVGSILAQPEELNNKGISAYKVEGIGYDFIPKVLDRSIIDRWIKTEDRESFIMARRLIREEGLLCGGSCGASVVAALEAVKTLKPNQRCVVLLADSVRNYMSKFLNDKWMYDNEFVEEKSFIRSSCSWWATKRVADLDLNSPITISPDVSCREGMFVVYIYAYLVWIC